VLPRNIYEHFLTLHVAISLLVNPKFCQSLNSYAQELLEFFVKTYITLYGSQFVSHNVYNLIHLAADTLKFGCLDQFSSFPFEFFFFIKTSRNTSERERNPCNNSPDVIKNLKCPGKVSQKVNVPKKEFLSKVCILLVRCQKIAQIPNIIVVSCQMT